MISSSTSSNKFWDSSYFSSPPWSCYLLSYSYSACFFLLSKTFFNLKKSSLACSSSYWSIYLYTAINFGITTCYKALTLLLVTFIFSSNVKNDAYNHQMVTWSPAISTKSVNIDLNFYLHFWMECPPRSNPIWLIALSLSSNSFTARAGMRTPAIFSSDFSSLIVALLTDSKTLPLYRKKNYWNYPAPYLASATRKKASLHY